MSTHRELVTPKNYQKREYQPFLILLIKTIWLFLTCVGFAQNATITINPAIQYQEIVGWEATAQAAQMEFPQMFSQIKDTLFDLLVNDLGINRLRLEIRSGSENPVDYFSLFLNGQITYNEWKSHWYEIINDNNDPNSINWNNFQFRFMDLAVDSLVEPIRQKVELNGEHLFINLCYVDFAASAFEHYNYPEEYAEFILATSQHLQTKYGWEPDGWEIILEPDMAAGWSPQQIAQCAITLGHRLQSNGFSPYLITPSNTNMSNAVSYFDQIVQYSGILPLIGELSYHRYSGVSYSALQSIGNYTFQYGIRSAHLEKIGATYEDLHDDLTIGFNSAWSQYTIAWPKNWGGDNGAQYYIINDDNPNAPFIEIASRTKFLRQYFKFVRAGARGIDAQSNNPDFEPIAFKNTDNSYVVIVKADNGGNFVVYGLPDGIYGIKYTTSNAYDIDLSDVMIVGGEHLSSSIPEAGVLTIYKKEGIPTGFQEKGNQLPKFTLFQNTPNPFNSTTNISYYLPSSGKVNLEVYNPLGQRIQTIVNQFQKSGFQKISWSANSLPSGIYILFLKFGGMITSRKMLLVK